MQIDEGIDEDGIVEGYDFETYYKPLESLTIEDGEAFVRVLMSDGGLDAETRIPFEALEAIGFVRRQRG